MTTGTKRAATFTVDATRFARREAPLDLNWPQGAVIVGTLSDDAHPWVLHLVVEWIVPEGVDPDHVAMEHRALQGFRSRTPVLGDTPIPIDAVWIGTVLDGPTGPLHIYEVNPLTSNYCQRCKCSIKWVRMEVTGRAMPIDPFPDPESGTVAVRRIGPGRLVGYVLSKSKPLTDGYELYRNHVQLCEEITRGGVSHRPTSLVEFAAEVADVDAQVDDDPPRFLHQPRLTPAELDGVQQ